MTTSSNLRSFSQAVLVPILLASCASEPNVVVVDPWVPPVESEDNSAIVAFVGEKISVREFDPVLEEDVILMDLAIKARYKVLDQLTGPQLPNRVVFDAYDHYGYPAFARHDVALLYLTKVHGDETFYHIKYTFDRVTQTRDGQWVKCEETYGWDDELLLEPQRIPNIRRCSRGNYALDVVQARIAAGQFDYD